MASSAVIAEPVSCIPALSDQHIELAHQQQQQQQQQQQAALLYQRQQQPQQEITMEHIEKELSVLAALPRPVRCRRVMPETAFAMLETLLGRLLNQATAAETVQDGATFSADTAANNNNNNDSGKGQSKSKAAAAAAAAASSVRPGSVVFLERADVWCDLLDEFAQTSELYGGDQPLSAEQLSALNSAAAIPTTAKLRSDQQTCHDDEASRGVVIGGGALVDPAAAAAAAVQAGTGTPIRKGPDSLGVNTAQTHGERDSLATRNLRSPPHHGAGSNNSPLSQSISVTLDSGSLYYHAQNRQQPGSPLRHSESALKRLVVEVTSSLALTTASSTSSATQQQQQQLQTPSRRALLLKIRVKEGLRDVFVKMSLDLAASIKTPKSYFMPPHIEKATRDLRAMQAEASKFAALTVELYSELEMQLTQQFQDVFAKARLLAGDRGWIGSVTERSRKDRTQRIVDLITDVYLMLAQLDARRSDATISVCRALLAIAGMESRRSHHEESLQLATEAASRLGRLYAKEATTINEFRATASAEAMQRQLALMNHEQQQQQQQQSPLGSASSSVAHAAAMSTFRFLCQVHETFGSGFPSPLELISDAQRETMGGIIVALQRRLNLIVPLRVAAHFNRASELEHTGAPDTECRIEYTAALTAGSSPRLPDFALIPQHPLMVKVSDAIASLVAAKMEKSRAVRFPTTNQHQQQQQGDPRVSSATLKPNADGKTRMAPRPPNSAGGAAAAGGTGGGRGVPSAPPPAFSRVANTRAAQEGGSGVGSTAATNRSARMIGGSEFSKHLTSHEVAGARESAAPHVWDDKRQMGSAVGEDKNLEMLKKFGIVPEHTESLLSKKKQVPISSVAHLDDNFIADPDEAAAAAAVAAAAAAEQNPNQRAEQNQIVPSLGFDPTATRSSNNVLSKQQQLNGTLTLQQQQQQQQQQLQLYQSQLDKQLEEKLSNRQTSLLSGVHGLMEHKSHKTHSRYESELDSIIARCKQAFALRDQGARVIQRAWRCAVARLEAYNRRQVFYHFLFQAQKAAGTAILATYRKHRQEQALIAKRDAIRNKRIALARHEVVRRKAVLTICRAIKKFRAQRMHEMDLMRRLRLKERERLLRSDVAAAVVQRWWKLVKHEVKYWRQRNAQLRVSKAEEAQAIRYHAAATTIQRVFRGHIGRYEAKLVKARVTEKRMALRRSVNYATDTVRTLLLEHRARRNRLEMLMQQRGEKIESAQRAIRTGWYDALERRKMRIVRARAREVALAARKLQCFWRCMMSKRELRYRRKVAETLSMDRIRKEWTRLRAARVVQGAWRVHRARRVLRALKAGVGREIINAIWALQRVGRAWRVRRSLCAERDLFQRLVRSAFAKATVFRNAQVVLVQRFLYPRTSQHVALRVHERRLQEKVVVWRGMRKEQQADRRATRLQAIGRGYLVRSGVVPALKREAALLLQKKNEASLTIQCGWRSGVARDQLRVLKGNRARDLERRRVWSEVQASLHADRLSSLGLMQQCGRQGIAKVQREARREILVAYFAPIVRFVSSSSSSPIASTIAAVTADETPTGTTAGAEAATTTDRSSSSSPSRGSSVGNSAERRIIDMYDESDEEIEKNEFVRIILNR